MSVTDALFIRWQWLGTSERLLAFLNEHDIIYVGDLATKTEAELLSHPDFSKKMLEEARWFLGYNSFQFGMNFPGWPPSDVAERSDGLCDFWRLPAIRRPA
jgi:DNA-directed RNA polymerase subunit alpha